MRQHKRRNNSEEVRPAGKRKGQAAKRQAADTAAN